MDNLMRERHVHGELPRLSTLELPSYFNEDEDSGSVATRALYNGGIEQNLLLDTYGRVTPAPVECLNFVGSQFLQPYSTLPKQVPPRAFLEEVFKFVIHCIDMVEPELLFHGLTNVMLSQDRYKFVYMLKTKDKLATMPLTDIDVYRKFPCHQYNYDYLLKNPGLCDRKDDTTSSHPWEFDVLWEHFQDSFEDMLDATLYAYWKEFFGVYFSGVSHIAVWATVMWIISPYDPAALEWRCNSMWVFDYMQAHDEVVIYGHALFTPDEYVKTEIAHGVCVVCNTQLPCANIYDALDGNYLYFCQAHRPRGYSNDGEPTYFEPESVYSHGLDTGYECPSCDYEDCPLKQQAGISVRSRLGRTGHGQVLAKAAADMSATDIHQELKDKLLREF